MKILKWIKEQVYYQQINWELLLFLILFLNVKLWVKVLSVIITCILNRKTLFTVKFWQNKMLLFYMSIILIGILNILFQADSLTFNYLAAAAVGILFWLLAAFASYQCFRIIEKSEPATVHATLNLFFLLNVLVSFAMFGKIIIETGAINPYTYQGLYQKYFITTGDYIRGISFDTSTTNAILNAFAVVYFINRKKALFTLLCMAALLLTGSNLTNMLLTGVLGFVFIFQSGRDQKSLIGICVACLIIFMVKISPQNNKYVQGSFKRILRKDSIMPPAPHADIIAKADSLLSTDERKQKFAKLYLDSMASLSLKKSLVVSGNKVEAIETTPVLPAPPAEKPSLPKDNIHSIPFQRKREETPLQKELIAYVKKDKKEDSIISSNKDGNRIPGKVLALQQTYHFFQRHPLKLLTGNGMGNFSSKLAFRTTGLNIAGGYPLKYVYINREFRENHLAIFLYYFSKDAQLHSIINMPNSVYDQLLSEYGIAGLLVFFIFYIGYYARKRKLLTYGIPVLLVMLGAFLVEYWFEQLSVLVVFELLLLLNIKENKRGLHGE
ncbi:MAG: hypothetical protein ABIN89_18820 [Chitinophagaceae bacterium]